MSVRLHCNNCNSNIAESAKKHDEYYKSSKGLALEDYLCDTCGIAINKGHECNFSLLLIQQPPQNVEKAFFENEPQKFIKPIQ